MLFLEDQRAHGSLLSSSVKTAASHWAGSPPPTPHTHAHFNPAKSVQGLKTSVPQARTMQPDSFNAGGGGARGRRREEEQRRGGVASSSGSSPPWKEDDSEGALTLTLPVSGDWC